MLYPDLARWQTALADRLTVAVLSNGAPEPNVAIAREYGLRDMALQDGVEIMREYRLQATPSAVLVAPDGTIASNPALGALTIEPLVRLALARDSGVPVAHLA